MDVRVGRLSAEEFMLSYCGVGEDFWEALGQQGDQTSQFWRKSTLNIHWKDWYWSWNSNTLHLMQRAGSLEKTLMLVKIGGKRRGATEDAMVGWHHQLSGLSLSQSRRQTVKDREAECAAADEVAKSDWTTATTYMGRVGVHYFPTKPWDTLPNCILSSIYLGNT